MKAFDFEPMRGIRGGVQFGMSREKVRTLLAPASADPFSRGKTQIDGFYGSALQVNYDGDGKVEFIEFARSVGVSLDGFDLFASEVDSVVAHLSGLYALDEEKLEPGYSFTFPAIELGLWRPVLPHEGSDEGRYFASAGFGRAGYYSKKEG